GVLRLLGAVLADREAGGGVEATRRLEPRIEDILLAAVLDAPDAAPGRLALAQMELSDERAGHLDGRAADLAVALREVGVADREQGARRVDRDQQGRPARQLLDVQV